MVTLVDVELFGQGVLGKTQNEAAMLLLWFLAALPVGAVVGGAIATMVGDRLVTFAGLLIAAVGYWLISKWPVDLMAYHHEILGLSLPAAHTDQLLAGFGLGLVIGPLTSAVMRAVPPREHGIAAAGVVVARMTGMLIGMAALSAWGLYRFNQILAGKSKAGGDLVEKMQAVAHNSREAFAEMYGEIFGITAIICVVGAVLGLFIGSNSDSAEDPEVPEPEAAIAR